MLSPIRSASNASLSSQGQAAAVVAVGLGRSVVAPTPVNAVEAADLNAAIAGKLNILLIAARQRMIEALLDIINATGRTISLQRGEGESDQAFATRVADAIRRMPDAEIDQIERQLSDDGHSLPLRMVAAALKDPTGPEATRVIAYLEIVRYKDRDLAARAVVRSYRQNDAAPPRTEPRPEIQLQEENRPASRQSAAKPAENAAIPAPAKVTAPAAAPVVVATDLTVEDQQTSSRDQSATAMHEASPQASTLRGTEEVQAAPAEQEVVEPEQAGSAEQAQSVQQTISAKADPVIPRNWTGIASSMTEQVSRMIATIIHEQEAAVLLTETPVEAAVEIDAMLDEVVISEATESLVRTTPEDAIEPASAQAAQASRPSQAEIAAVAQTARSVREIAAQSQPVPVAVVETPSYIPLAARMPEGLPYAQTPYQFARDEYKATRADEPPQHHHENGGSQDQQQQAQSGQGGDEQQAGEGDAPREERRQPNMVDADPSTAPVTVADPVYALYQRMVGWE